jgi:hypothetical protein
VKVANQAQTQEAAEKYAKLDLEGKGNRGRCNPSGSFHAWCSIENLWNSYSYETSQQVSRERPLAHDLFVKSYLAAQGWVRK